MASSPFSYRYVSYSSRGVTSNFFEPTETSLNRGLPSSRIGTFHMLANSLELKRSTLRRSRMGRRRGYPIGQEFPYRAPAPSPANRAAHLPSSAVVPGRLLRVVMQSLPTKFDIFLLLDYYIFNPFIGVRCALMALPEYIGKHPFGGVFH